MRNKDFKIKTIFSLVKTLPYFDFNDLSSIETNKTYLKILFSRYAKAGKLIRLKKGLYTAKDYIEQVEKRGNFSLYTEFLANILHQPSYLSLDYILYQHNLLTEMPVNFTSVSKSKTTSFSNHFGIFFYHKIKDELFCGFDIIKSGDFTIFRASKAKAFFDYVYFRKNDLLNKRAVEELRLNFQNLKSKDRIEIKKYLQIEGSKKMSQIFNWIFS